METAAFWKNVKPDNGKHKEATGGLDKFITAFEVAGRRYVAEITRLATDNGDIFYELSKFNDPEVVAAFEEILQKFLSETPNGWLARQLSNQDNIQAHYKYTGPEIWEDTDGAVNIFIGGVGTGGSTHGVSKYLKEKNAGIKTIVAQPDPASVENSVIEGATDGGFHGIHQVHDDNGLTAMAPDNFSSELMDAYEFVTYAETLKAVHLLAKYEGVFVGASSGASLAVAIREAKKIENEGKLIVPLLPDNGERYLSEDLQKIRPELEDGVNF